MNPFLVALFLSCTAFAAEEDILARAAAHPRDSRVQQADGTMRVPKFGDYKLEQAEAYLAPRFPRPWTFSKVLAWYRVSKNATASAHLLRVLAASRQPEAALILGEALHSDSLPSRVAGCSGLLDYFDIPLTSGGSEQQMDSATRWFSANKERLQKATSYLTSPE